LEQKVGLSPADPAFRYQTAKDQRASEPVPSRVRFLRKRTHRWEGPKCLVGGVRGPGTGIELAATSDQARAARRRSRL
jgi:hypothetical protein